MKLTRRCCRTIFPLRSKIAAERDVRQTHPSQGVFTMAAFDIRDMGTEACPDCGAVYKVQYQELPLKDDDEFICACGHTMASWRETGMYMYTLIQEAE